MRRRLCINNGVIFFGKSMEKNMIGPKTGATAKISEEHFRLWMARKLSQVQIAKEVGCHRTLVARKFKIMLMERNGE